MKALLDTHIILWTLAADPKLPVKAKEMILDKNNELFWSSASMWEVTIKHLSHPDRLKISGSKLAEACDMLGFYHLPITRIHVKMLENLKRPDNAPAHNDPFDKILIAQAKSENLVFVTHDSLIPYYQEPCIFPV